ncbi:MAG: NAD+ synthase [Candidatus Altiarchaeia archaeon]
MKKLLLGREELASCRKTIENSIRDYVRSSGASGAVLGLSGGIDSALVCKLACGSGIKVHALIMPEDSISSERDVLDAVDLAKDCGVSYSMIKINKAVNAFDSSFPWGDYEPSRRTPALGNAKARVRMTYNYLAANCGNLLVLGTGNRTEILLGYATKYGDAGVDMQPIGALYKTQVRQMAACVGVPQRIIDKAPTAGLWTGQTDEGELGAKYEDMDRVLFFLAEENRSVSDTAKQAAVDEALVVRLRERMIRNEHKRALPQVVGLFD